MSNKNDYKERLGQGVVKRYKTGSVYIPTAIWDMVSKDEFAEYVADMQSVLIFKPRHKPRNIATIHRSDKKISRG